MSNKKGIRFFYQVATDIFYYNGDDDKLKQETVRTKEILKYCYYEAFKGYECNSESLNQYRDDFNKWSFELLNNDIMKIDYKKYYNHESATFFIFGMRSSKVLKEYKIQNILFYEFYLFEMCNNGAIMTLCKDYKNKVVQSFGYDYSSYYPTLLASDYYTSIYPKKIGQSFIGDDFKLPIKKGKLTHVKIDFSDEEYDYTTLKYGIYNCFIACNNKDFIKIFAFNTQNYYTHYDIQFACKYKKRFDIRIEMEYSDELNALIYEEEDLIYSHKIFKDWYRDMSKLKKEFPKNKLLKHAFSSLWGSLIRFERDFKEDGEIFEIDASDIDSKAHTKYKVINEKHYKCDKNKTKKKTIYEIIESDKPYTHNLARLKPFFTAFTRVNIGELCIKENILSDVIRIHTDNITLTKPHDFTKLKYYPIKEDKTTGTFLWKNVNKYPSYDKKTKSYTWKNEPYEDK